MHWTQVNRFELVVRKNVTMSAEAQIRVVNCSNWSTHRSHPTWKVLQWSILVIVSYPCTTLQAIIICTIVFYLLFQQHVPCLLDLWNFQKCLLMSKSRVLSKKYHFGRTQAHLLFISFHCPQIFTAILLCSCPRVPISNYITERSRWSVMTTYLPNGYCSDADSPIRKFYLFIISCISKYAYSVLNFCSDFAN